jgi:pilus assembly protein CpaC
VTGIKCVSATLALVLALLLTSAIQGQEASAPRDLFVTAGKSLVVDSPVIIQRVAVANSELAEAIAVTPTEVLVNGKTAGETSLVIWQQGGNRLIFDLNVRSSSSPLEAVRRELAKELPGQDVSISLENGVVFLRGTTKDLVSAERAATIAATLGKTVNLLRVAVPSVDAQVLLKVRFANVDRAASSDLGFNFFSTGLGGNIGSTTTGQFAAPTNSTVSHDGSATFQLTDALNIFLFRPDLNLGATIRALQNKRMLEILAEPNVLAIDGKTASFLAGGEFPFPVVQGGANAGAVTIQFREFGVRLTFLPKITPRGSVRLQVTPEVSSLDFANGLIFQGFNIPAISTRRVQTEIELENGQSFAIAGLLDNRVTDSLNKVPGLGDIPLFGKLFQSRSRSKNNSELLIVVTPELVRPIPAGQAVPEVKMPAPFLEGGATQMPRTPGMEATGPVPVKPPREAMPVEELIKSLQPSQTSATPTFTPSPAIPNPPAAQPASTPAPAPAAAPPKSAAG